MENQHYEITFQAMNVAESLGIGRSTLNKYSRSLEETGYEFHKDERGNRAYTERDIVALRNLIALLEINTPYEKAMKSTVERYGRKIATQPKDVATAATYSGTTLANPEFNGINLDSAAMVARYEALQDQMGMLVEMNKALFVRLDEQDQFIKRSITDRDAQLMAALREMREERQQLAAAIEEEKKKSVWKRLFGK